MGTRPIDSGGRVVENARTAPRAACGLHAPTAAGPVLEPRRSKAEIDEAEEVLSPDALTIGFCRRFASYKRANLLIRNPERLVRILNNPAHPVQIYLRGQAIPTTTTASSWIAAINRTGQTAGVPQEIVFLENYDVTVARYMVQGCDVWLNTPLRPFEASGTSGMKAQANGVLNFSTLDGWWDEAWELGIRHKRRNWLGYWQGGTYSDFSRQDDVEADALYDLLEGEIVPAFYARPRRWPAHEVDFPDEGLDRHTVPRVQYASHGQAIHE